MFLALDFCEGNYCGSSKRSIHVVDVNFPEVADDDVFSAFVSGQPVIIAFGLLVRSHDAAVGLLSRFREVNIL